MWKCRKQHFNYFVLMLLLRGLIEPALNKDNLSFFYSDVDECNASIPACDVNAKCKNTIGSFLCTCNIGYHGDGKSCQGKRKWTKCSRFCRYILHLIIVRLLCRISFSNRWRKENRILHRKCKLKNFKHQASNGKGMYIIVDCCV